MRWVAADEPDVTGYEGGNGINRNPFFAVAVAEIKGEDQTRWRRNLSEARIKSRMVPNELSCLPVLFALLLAGRQSC